MLFEHGRSAVPEPYQNPIQMAHFGLLAERKQTPQIVEEPRNRKRYWRRFVVLRSKRSAVRICPGVPVFYHLAALHPSKMPSRPFAQVSFCPRIVHFEAIRLLVTPTREFANQNSNNPKNDSTKAPFPNGAFLFFPRGETMETSAHCRANPSGIALRYPSWSPRGDRVIFERYDLSANIYVVDLR